MRKHTILVTGASGLLGANLVLEAKDRDMTNQVDIIGLYYQHPIDLVTEGMHSLHCDLTDHVTTRDLILSIRPDWIVHCAAATDVDWCEDHPKEATRINAVASGHLAALAKELDARLAYISTDAVFAGEMLAIHTEENRSAPINTYGKSKRAGELAVMRELPTALIVRTCFYGWNAQDKFSLAEWMLSRLREGREVPAFTDVWFTPILVNRLARLVLHLLGQNLSGVYHVAGSQNCTKHSFAVRLADTYGLDTTWIRPTLLADAGLRAPRPRHPLLSTRKLALTLGYSLMPSLQDDLAKFRELEETEYVDRLKALTKREQGCPQ